MVIKGERRGEVAEPQYPPRSNAQRVPKNPVKFQSCFEIPF